MHHRAFSILVGLGLSLLLFMGACTSSPPATTCQRDNECSVGQICKDQNCIVPACTDQKPCSDGAICKEGTCVKCAKDDECGADKVCESGGCKSACSDQAPCTNGQLCDKGRCRSCKDDAECGADTICENESCVAGCRDDKSCAQGQICEQNKISKMPISTLLGQPVLLRLFKCHRFRCKMYSLSSTVQITIVLKS